MTNKTEYMELNILLTNKEYERIQWLAKWWNLSEEDYVQKVLIEEAWLNRESTLRDLYAKAIAEAKRRGLKIEGYT